MRTFLIWSVILNLVLIACVAFSIPRMDVNFNLHTVPSLAECTSEKAKLIKPERIDVPFLTQLTESCYSASRNQGLLNDFQIRRVKFLHQHFADNVILWMVVGITLSGVLLAGLQLAASYKLAVARGTELAAGGELSFSKGGDIVLKSSITGLFILLISFAFFLVFVTQVYDIKERNVDGKEAVPTVSQGIPTGAYGTSAPSAAQSPSAATDSSPAKARDDEKR